MRVNFFGLLTACILIFWSSIAMAVSCTITSTGLVTTHTPNAATQNITQSSFTFTCSRGALELISSTSYSIAVNDGIHATGTQNQAQAGGVNILYETYRTSSCGSGPAWSSTGPFTGTLNLPNANTNYSVTINYWGCIPINQQVPAATYNDTVTMTATFDDPLIIIGGRRSISNTFPVTITNPAVCSITSIADVAFGNYVAFRATSLNAPAANIVLNCTPQLSYSMTLDANSGVVAGLNYTLSLSATSSSGTGPGQTHQINGTMQANQAGTCATSSCTASSQRTLTITY